MWDGEDIEIELCAKIIKQSLKAIQWTGIGRLARQCAKQLVPVERQIKFALLQAEVIHLDEARLYVEYRRSWIHVTTTRHMTHYQVHQNRGMAALNNGILPGYQDTSGRDGWLNGQGPE